MGVPNVIKVVAQMLTHVCIAHAGVHGFESYLADVLVSVIGCSQPGQELCYFIARYTTMAWNPHERYFVEDNRTILVTKVWEVQHLLFMACNALRLSVMINALGIE